MSEPRAPQWHDDLVVSWIGPSTDDRALHFEWEAPPLDPTGEMTNAAPRSLERKHEPFRDAFRAFVRAAYEVDLLRRQKLFALVDRRTGERVDPLLASIDWTNYYPIGRPSLPELLAAYAFHLRLPPDEVLRP